MIAEILETMFMIAGSILMILIMIAGYYVSYKMYRDYRKDKFLKGDKLILFSAIFSAFFATMMGLVLLWATADLMGW